MHNKSTTAATHMNPPIHTADKPSELNDAALDDVKGNLLVSYAALSSKLTSTAALAMTMASLPPPDGISRPPTTHCTVTVP